MTKTISQVAPGAPIVTYNSRPLKVHGVKYQPKWEWSDWYRDTVKQSMSQRGPVQADRYDTGKWHRP